MPTFLATAAVLVAALLVVYGGHFDNDFHFDDWHTIKYNPAIGSLGNARLFFSDSRTFSTEPWNQTYRPMLSLSYAFDSFLGGTQEKPFWFRLSNFAYYCSLLLLLFFFLRAILDARGGGRENSCLALFGTALYGLHTVNAETVNYLTARSDLLSTLFVVVGFVIYLRGGVPRRLHLHLVPMTLGVLTKPSAIMFAPLLLCYLLVVERRITLPEILRGRRTPEMIAALLYALPSLCLGLFLYFLQDRMTQPSYFPSQSSPLQYLLSQPFVAALYGRNFLLPLWLSVDYGLRPLQSAADWRFLVGLVFAAAVVAFGLWSASRPGLLTAAFGTAWFVLALLPSSSVFPLAEVMNDHRTFFPYIGCVIVVIGLLDLLRERLPLWSGGSRTAHLLLAVGVLAVLVPHVLGARQRTKLWKSGELLWSDAVAKNPRNPRALLNYGIALMKRGDYGLGMEFFSRALEIEPDNMFVHLNLGKGYEVLRIPSQAEQHYRAAARLAPNNYQPYYQLGRLLLGLGRKPEARDALAKASDLTPFNQEIRSLLHEANGGR